MRLCRCGSIVADRCERCQPAPKQTKTTAERGYGHDWRKFSETYREEFPLCQVCLMNERIEPARHTHHIIKIADFPELRLDRTNVLSVCQACHELVEKDTRLAREAKKQQDAWGNE